jgi:hypothetical protein
MQIQIAILNSWTSWQIVTWKRRKTRVFTWSDDDWSAIRGLILRPDQPKFAPIPQLLPCWFPRPEYAGRHGRVSSQLRRGRWHIGAGFNLSSSCSDWPCATLCVKANVCTLAIVDSSAFPLVQPVPRCVLQRTCVPVLFSIRWLFLSSSPCRVVCYSERVCQCYSRSVGFSSRLARAALCVTANVCACAILDSLAPSLSSAQSWMCSQFPHWLLLTFPQVAPILSLFSVPWSKQSRQVPSSLKAISEIPLF